MSLRIDLCSDAMNAALLEHISSRTDQARTSESFGNLFGGLIINAILADRGELMLLPQVGEESETVQRGAKEHGLSCVEQVITDIYGLLGYKFQSAQDIRGRLSEFPFRLWIGDGGLFIDESNAHLWPLTECDN
jgi:hypothetical protein